MSPGTEITPPAAVPTSGESTSGESTSGSTTLVNQPDPAGLSGLPGLVSTRDAVRARWMRWRWILAVAVVIALAALITAVTSAVSGDGDRLGPANPAPDGSRAVAQILRRQGVNIQVVDRSTEAVAATSSGSTLLVTRPGLLAPEQLDRLVGDDVTNIVLIEPDEIILSRLAPQLRTAGRSTTSVAEPDCTVPAAQAAGSTRAGGQLYATVAEPPSGSGVCYPAAGGGEGGSYATWATPGRTVTVIGQSDVLTNEHLDADGNAALSLWTLGARPTLVWYTPDPLEPAGSGGQPSMTELLPDWVFWVLAQITVTVAVAIVWRARRLGALVTEPLPVVVRAAETQEGRARLYRQASARGRAAATLRTSCLRRLAARLSAPAGTTPAELVTLVARATGRDDPGERALHELLLGPAPESDAALIKLADDLDSVERELSRDRPVRST